MLYTDVVNRVDPFWRPRLREMMLSVLANRHECSTVSNVRVAKGWPRRGSVMFTR